MTRSPIRWRAALCGFTLAWLASSSAWSAPVSYVQIGSIGSPGSATQLVYSSGYGKLVFRNGGSAVRVVNLADGATQTFYSTTLFTDMSLSPSGRYVFVADYGYENIGYGTPKTPSHVGRLDLETGTWQSKDAAGAIAYHIEAVDDDHFVLTSLDQWITFTYDSWGTGAAITVLSPIGPYWPGYSAGVYYGDIEFDAGSSRVIHGNSGSSSQEITAFKITGNTFTPQEDSGTYGSASNHGGTSVLAVDGSAFYYGRLQVDPLDVSHNRRVFPELIRAANGRAAFGGGSYYDPATGDLLGSLGFAATVYAPNHFGDDFWAYDPSTESFRHFAATDGPLPTEPEAHADLVRTTSAPQDIDVLANDFGFANPVTVTIDTPPSHGTATVIGSPGEASGVRIRYTPSPGYFGPDSLGYTVSDGLNADSANVGITVESFRANPDSVYAGHSYGSTYVFVARNDVGFANPVTLTITSSPSRGYAYTGQSTGDAQSVYVTYSPSTADEDFTDTFTYQISDGVHTDTATVTIQVVSLIAAPDSATTNVETQVQIDATQNDVISSYQTTIGLYETARH